MPRAEGQSSKIEGPRRGAKLLSGARPSSSAVPGRRGDDVYIYISYTYMRTYHHHHLKRCSHVCSVIKYIYKITQSTWRGYIDLTALGGYSSVMALFPEALLWFRRHFLLARSSFLYCSPAAEAREGLLLASVCTMLTF